MSDIKKIAVIGNYLPRRCGLATFTTDLCNAIAGEMEDEASNLVAVAMDDIVEGYDYADRVKFQVQANLLSDYLSAADFLNLHKFDVAILQHEFGLTAQQALIECSAQYHPYIPLSSQRKQLILGLLNQEVEGVIGQNDIKHIGANSMNYFGKKPACANEPNFPLLL